MKQYLQMLGVSLVWAVVAGCSSPAEPPPSATTDSTFSGARVEAPASPVADVPVTPETIEAQGFRAAEGAGRARSRAVLEQAAEVLGQQDPVDREAVAKIQRQLAAMQ